jgi:leucyl-tRNA synthetase
MENHPVRHKELYPLSLAQEEAKSRFVLSCGTKKFDTNGGIAFLLQCQRRDLALRCLGQDSFLCVEALSACADFSSAVNAYGLETVFLSLFNAQNQTIEKTNKKDDFGLMASWKWIHRLWDLSFSLDFSAVLNKEEAFLLQKSVSFAETKDISSTSLLPVDFDKKQAYQCFMAFKSCIKKVQERLKKEKTGVPLIVFSAVRVFAPFLAAYVEKKRGLVFPDVCSVFSLEQSVKKWVVQINGRKKGVLFLPSDLKKEEVQKQILSNALIQNKLSGKKIKNKVTADSREKGLVNFVVEDFTK